MFYIKVSNPSPTGCFYDFSRNAKKDQYTYVLPILRYRITFSRSKNQRQAALKGKAILPKRFVDVNFRRRLHILIEACDCQVPENIRRICNQPFFSPNCFQDSTINLWRHFRFVGMINLLFQFLKFLNPMNAKLQALAGVAVMLFLFSSCQKDIVDPVEEQVAQSDLATTASATNPNDVPETAPPIHTAITTNVNSNVAGYLESLPARYHLTTKSYPMILFIHGIGELGSGGVTKINCCGLPKHLSNKTFPPEFTVNGSKYSFIVISPQFKARPSAANMQDVIDYAVNKYRVDRSRIYVAGLSMGGGSTFDYSVVYGQNIAAAVPVCAGSSPSTAKAQSLASKNLPFWTISSKADVLVPIQWARDWVNWTKNYNSANAANIKLTEWTNESHNGTWARAFDPNTRVDGYNVYEWMLKYKRSGVTTPPPANNPPAPTPPASGNKPPVAKAGEDQTIPLSWNYFPKVNGTTSTDPDGWIKSFHWSKVSGPSQYTIVSPDAGQTKLDKLVAGVYVFRLTVTDNSGATATDDVTITMVNDNGSTPPSDGGGTTNPVPGNKAPIARAGEDRTIPMSWNYFPQINGTTSTDPDGWIKAFQWTKVSGPSQYTIVSPNAGLTKLNNLVAGTYVFRLTVTDNSGATSTDDVTITMVDDKSTSSSGGASSAPPVNDPVPPAPLPAPGNGNQLPVAKAGADQTIPVSWNYFPQVNGTTSFDPDGWIKAFQWTKVSGPSSYTIVSPNAGLTKINNLVAGTYVFRLTVTDNNGATATDDVTIIMTNDDIANQAPVAKAGEDQTIPLSWNYFPQINGTTSHDPDGWIAAFQWTKVSGPSSYTIVNPNAGLTKVNNLVKGTYVFRLTVTDNKGLKASDDVIITME